MNAARVATELVRPATKLTQRTLVRNLQSMAQHNHHITPASGTPPPPPSAGMMRAWQTLQEENWVTTKGHLTPQPLETFNLTLTEKSILGSRNLGVFETSSNSENVGSSVRALLTGFKFD
ncbi:uncharacterized protein LOC132565032 [Ylistrum balloti]|uniref:uncharacterized protein LOC132565032 n=1 Tax=Ylistrum balloti TaxID=509963 RepID=UPI0029058998|nr:uncharacterized protein LOC132565032 [Ylistrum balloti]